MSSHRLGFGPPRKALAPGTLTRRKLQTLKHKIVVRYPNGPEVLIAHDQIVVLGPGRPRAVPRLGPTHPPTIDLGLATPTFTCPHPSRSRAPPNPCIQPAASTSSGSKSARCCSRPAEILETAHGVQVANEHDRHYSGVPGQGLLTRKRLHILGLVEFPLFTIPIGSASKAIVQPYQRRFLPLKS